MVKELSQELRKLIAYELTITYPQDDPRTSAKMIGEAKIDFNPHQIEAALFGYKALQMGGAILGDEVGLGKTIEAGLIINQCWTEGKNRILIISPVSLRSQWKVELSDLFYLDSTVITSQDWKQLSKIKENPIEKKQAGIFILGTQLVFRNFKVFMKNHWDLIVIDEAHKLRNVYKKSKKEAKMAKKVRETFARIPKILLTATPLQNRVDELYGLVSLIDPSYFGTYESFQRLYGSGNLQKIGALRDRLKPIFKRALRKDVSDYLTYTKRESVTVHHNYERESEEKKLHENIIELLVSEYLLLNNKTSRGFMDLIYLKLLGSSPYAINSALLKMLSRFLQGLVKRDIESTDFTQWLDVIRTEFKKYPAWERHFEKMAQMTCKSHTISFEKIKDYLS